MNKLLKRTNDLIFKVIFGSEKNIDILEDFLKAALRLPDEEFSYLRIANPFSTIDKIDDKTVILDVKVYTKSKHVINVEMQVSDDPDLRNRIVFYAAKNLTEQMHRGDDYTLKKVVNILITDFILIKENDVYHNIYHLHDAKTGSTFTELIEINTLEIPKLKECDESPLTDWLRFLSTDKEEELKMLGQKNEKIEKATNPLYELSKDEETRMLYDAREKTKWAEQSRLRGAEEKGVLKGLTETAKNFLRMGLSPQQVMEGTGLEMDEIERIRLKL